jgi:hypothetical protein
MWKRIMLGLAFLAAFSLVGVATPDTSEARRFWRRPFVGRVYVPGPVVYRPYRASFYGGPRYYRTYYGPPAYYGYPDYDYYGPRRGVYFSWGY